MSPAKKKPQRPEADSVDAIVAELWGIYFDENTKPGEKIKCLDKISDLLNLVTYTGQKDLKKIPPAELERMWDEHAMPIIRRFGIQEKKEPDVEASSLAT